MRRRTFLMNTGKTAAMMRASLKQGVNICTF